MKHINLSKKSNNKLEENESAFTFNLFPSELILHIYLHSWLQPCWYKPSLQLIRGVNWPSTRYKKRKEKALKAISRQVYIAQNTYKGTNGGKDKASSWTIFTAPKATGCGKGTSNAKDSERCHYHSVLKTSTVTRLKREFLGHGLVFQCLICPSIVTRSVPCTYL